MAWLLSLVASAGLLTVAGGLHPLAGLLFVAPVPALAYAHRARLAPALAVTAGAWLLGGWPIARYLVAQLEIPPAVALLFLLPGALQFAAAAALSRALLRRGLPGAATFALPTLWVATEHVVTVMSPHGAFGHLASTQIDSHVLVQLAALTGPAGLSFVPLLVASLLGVLSTRPPAVRPLIIGVAAILAGVVGFGVYRLRSGPSGTMLTVGLAAVDEPVLPRPPTEPATATAIAAYLRVLDDFGQAGVRYAVLPESIAAVDDEAWPGFAAPFAAAAARHHMTVVVGVDRISADGEHNRAVAFPPDGGAPLVYTKQHLVPGFERRYTPGRGIAVGDGFGVSICKDLDFPALGRAYGQAGVPLLLVPAWDFDTDAWLHARMAVLRGVESGFAVARAARDGKLTLSDTRGRVLAEAPSGTPLRSLTASVPVAATPTVYRRFGDVLAWLCVAALLPLVILAMRRRTA